MSAARLPGFVPADLDDDQRALYDAIVSGPRGQGQQAFALTDDAGRLSGPFNAMLTSPAVGTALQALGAASRYGSSLPGRAREIAILVVAHRWHSAFEIDAHEAVATVLGLSPEELRTVRSGQFDDLEDVTERTVAVTALALATHGDLSDDEYDAAVDALGTAAVFELTTVVGYYAMLAMQLRVFRV